MLRTKRSLSLIGKYFLEEVVDGLAATITCDASCPITSLGSFLDVVTTAAIVAVAVLVIATPVIACAMVMTVASAVPRMTKFVLLTAAPLVGIVSIALLASVVQINR